MAQTPSPDARPARWIMESELAYEQLVCFGPSGFPAYARLRFIPDPTHPSHNETAPVPVALPDTE
ncbi:hypothetical protein [Arthrobacter sp. E3]|uniref:hypothetical protein n=1 Tax=Arthrobacter sp. E3 TaxID=517402 RepID=UPI001A9464F1|nr:hypothetical protein [Arthrobacter sp. E3]